jgi:hypothetical protein
VMSPCLSNSYILSSIFSGWAIDEGDGREMGLILIACI